MMKIKCLILFFIIGNLFFHAQTNNLEKNTPETRSYKELEKEYSNLKIIMDIDGDSKYNKILPEFVEYDLDENHRCCCLFCCI